MPNFNDEDRDSSTDDDWDASSSDEDKKPAVTAAPGKKKKGLAAKIAEREAKEAEQRRKQQEMADMTPAQKKAMIEKEEEANADDFLGEDDGDNINLNKHVPKSKHEFHLYTEQICARFALMTESPFYEDFVKDVTRNLIKPLNLDKTRAVEQVLKVQINEQVKTGKKSKKSSKKTLNTGGGKGGISTAVYGDDDYDDDLDDLMWFRLS